MSADTLRATRTGYLVTEVQADSDGSHVLTWRAGADRPPRPAPDAASVAGVTRVRADGVVLVAGRDDGDGRRFRVPGPAPLSLLLSAGIRAEPLRQVCADLGGALAGVHTVPAAPDLGPPAATSRLRAWLRTGDGPRAADRARAVVGTALGEDGVATVLAALDGFADAGEDAAGEDAPSEDAAVQGTTLLGAPGSLTVYPDPAGGPATVLVTDELARGPHAWDLGWLVGELFERSLATPDAEPQLRSAAGALLGGHAQRRGATTDPGLIAAAAASRTLAHVHDYAAYVGWDDALADRAGAVTAWLGPQGDRLERGWCHPVDPPR